MRRDHFDELEADFQQYYSLDVAMLHPARAARLLFQLPSESRLVRLLQPSNNWGWTEMLLNKVGYLLEVLIWQKTKDGQKKTPTNAPKMYTPEFMRVAGDNRDLDAHTTDDIKEILAKPRR